MDLLNQFDELNNELIKMVEIIKNIQKIQEKNLNKLTEIFPLIKYVPASKSKDDTGTGHSKVE